MMASLYALADGTKAHDGIHSRITKSALRGSRMQTIRAAFYVVCHHIPDVSHYYSVPHRVDHWLF